MILRNHLLKIFLVVRKWPAVKYMHQCIKAALNPILPFQNRDAWAKTGSGTKVDDELWDVLASQSQVHDKSTGMNFPTNFVGVHGGSLWFVTAYIFTQTVSTHSKRLQTSKQLGGEFLCEFGDTGLFLSCCINCCNCRNGSKRGLLYNQRMSAAQIERRAFFSSLVQLVQCSDCPAEPSAIVLMQT